jgi:hypothetical protein
MKHVKFNVNHSVKVKLKDKGIEHIVKMHNELMPFKFHTSFKEYKNKADEFGYHTLQLWSFIDHFGNLGMQAWQYFDTNIIFEFKDFEPFEFKKEAV